MHHAFICPHLLEHASLYAPLTPKRPTAGLITRASEACSTSVAAHNASGHLLANVSTPCPQHERLGPMLANVNISCPFGVSNNLSETTWVDCDSETISPSPTTTVGHVVFGMQRAG